MSSAAAQAIYGIMAEFEHPEELLKAARRAYEKGYRRLDAYSPFPVEGLSEAIGFHEDRVALIVLIAGVLGGLSGFYLQYWVNLTSYKLNVGGRPPDSWPAFIIITFELTILCAGIASLVGMFALNGLPKPYHPVFNEPAFARATRDRFFLCIEAADPLFHEAGTRVFLESLGASYVAEVEP